MNFKVRRIILTAALIAFIYPSWAQIPEFTKWLALPVEMRGELSQQKFSKKALTAKETQAVTDTLYRRWLDDLRRQYGDQWQDKQLNDSLAMRFDYRIFGEKEHDSGRSLWISLHGGGSAPTHINDGQWKNQIELYKPEEGLYVAPRAPWDDWNMWFKPGIDEMYELFILIAIAMEDVDPNRVYLFGYSAGGDGVYRIASRLADRWAAAAMMAGHPGEASQVNLRNLPFMIWMGAEDSSFDRNKWAATIGERLDSLHTADPGGYVHQTHIVAGKSHWMDREDTAALPWMAQYERNPFPDRIVWRQEEVVRPAMYWLSVPAEDASHGMEVRARRSGNNITIEKNDYPELTIHLNDKMFDLDKPITVRVGEKIVFKGKVERNIENIVQSWNDRGDYYYLFPAKIVIRK